MRHTALRGGLFSQPLDRQDAAIVVALLPSCCLPVFFFDAAHEFHQRMRRYHIAACIWSSAGLTPFHGRGTWARVLVRLEQVHVSGCAHV